MTKNNEGKMSLLTSTHARGVFSLQVTWSKNTTFWSVSGHLVLSQPLTGCHKHRLLENIFQGTERNVKLSLPVEKLTKKVNEENDTV
jgi:hypothetical protein